MTCFAGTGSGCRPQRGLLGETPPAYEGGGSPDEPGLASFLIRSGDNTVRLMSFRGFTRRMRSKLLRR